MDVPKGPKTTEEAQALPEDDGLASRLDRMPMVASFDGDTILYFADVDGRPMEVEFDGERWVKKEMR